MPLQKPFQLLQQMGKIALGLGHRERAGRQSDAAQRIQAETTKACVTVEPVSVDQRLNGCSVVRPDVRDDHILVRGEAEFAVMNGRDRTHAVQ